MISALALKFTEIYNLSATEKSILIAIPVLLGSIGRLPAGMLADRFGGRNVFTGLLFLSAIPAILVGFSNSYTQLILFGLFLGLAGTTFSVEVGFTSKWFPPEKQGFALGVYGMGNIGLINHGFRRAGFDSVARCLAAGLLHFCGNFAHLGHGFYLFARDATVTAKPKTLAENFTLLKTSKIAWGLSLFYFLTFCGFVSFAIYLPMLLKDLFLLSPTDAGARTAVFVLLATLMRPLGGALADKLGGAKVLLFVFAALAAFSLLLGLPTIAPFTLGGVGVLGLGLGNDAVFKLVPEYFPKETGTVTGLVGAFGGLGGFFPPLLLGIVKDSTGNYNLGFIFLTAFAVMCLAINYFVFLCGLSVGKMNAAI